MGENLCKWFNQQRFNLQNIQVQLLQLNKKTNPIEKWTENLNGHFYKEDIQMSSKDIKKCWASLIRQMQIKTTMKFHFIPVRVIMINKSTKNKHWTGCREKGTLFHCSWECKLVQPLWKTVWKFIRKLNIELPYHPGIPLLCIYLFKTFIEKDACTHVFTSVLFTLTKTWKQWNAHWQRNGLRCGKYI